MLALYRSLLGRNRIFWKIFCQYFDNITAMKRALGAEVASGRRRILKEKNVCSCNILNMDIGLNWVGISLGWAIEVFQDMDDASIYSWLQNWSKHQNGIKCHHVYSSLLCLFPSRLLCHSFTVAIPVLHFQDCWANIIFISITDFLKYKYENHDSISIYLNLKPCRPNNMKLSRS